MSRVSVGTALWLAAVSSLCTALALGPGDKSSPAMLGEVREPLPTRPAAPEGVEHDRMIFQSIRETDWSQNF